MKFLQTSRGCRVTFEDGEEFAGKELFIVGEKYSKGFGLDSNNMKWISQDNGKTIGTLISQDIKEKVKALLIEEGKKQGIVIGFYEGRQNV